MSLTIYEYAEQGKSRSGVPLAGEVRGDLATDALGLPIKTLTPTTTAQDIQLSSRTRMVQFVTDGSTRIRYRFRPRSERNMAVNANSIASQAPTSEHPTVGFSSVVSEATYSGAVVSIVSY